MCWYEWARGKYLESSMELVEFHVRKVGVEG